MTDAIVIAVKLLGQSDDVQPEPFYISPGISWRDLRAMLLALYETSPADLDVRYEDEDGDMCILSSDDELKESIRYCQHTANVLQLNVRAMEADVMDLFQVNEIYVNPHSLFTDAEKEEISYNLEENKKKMTQPVDSPSELSSELAETGESAPNHVFDEETGLMHTQKEMFDVPPCEVKQVVDRKEIKLVEIPEHEPVVRKKACYYELQGSDMPADDLEKLEKLVTGQLENKDQESGELSTRKSEEGESMPYQAFVHFMEKLKQELRNEIVHDVTKKTVKQVLKGLDTTWPFTAASRKENRNAHPLYLHEKILCDVCQKTIIGPRYKCGNCPDFDLCEDCEAKPGVHDLDHVFVKLRRPCLEAGMKDGKKVPLLKYLLYTSAEKLTEEDYKLRLKKWKDRMDRRQERLRKKEEKVQEKQKKKEDKLKRKLEKLDTSANRYHPQKREKVETQGLMLPQFKQPYQVLGAQFVSDVTIPDQTCVQPGTRLYKTWKMKNTGSHQWSTCTRLRLMWGTIPAPKTEVSVPVLDPNEEGNITVELIAPEEPGKYQSHWKLFDSGVNFGHRVWCSIIVEPRELLEPTKGNQLKMVESTDIQTDVQQSNAALKDEDDDPEEKFEEPQAEDPTEEVFLEAVEERASPIIMATKLVPASVISVKSVPDRQVEITESDSKVMETENVGSQVETEALAPVDEVGLHKHKMVDCVAVEGVADLLSFEFLDLNDRKTSKASQTATPNNTPLDVSPPKSPALEPVIPASVSNSSSVELVGNEGETDLPHLTEYVQQRMASLELKPDTFDEADIESLSSLSSDDESEDYCIVPLPECFITDLPLSQSAVGQLDDNQNEIGTQDENGSDDGSTDSHQPSLDEMLTTSGVMTTPALNPEPAPEQVKQTQIVSEPSREDRDEGTQLLEDELRQRENGEEPAVQSARVVDENQNSEEDREGNVPIQSTPSEFVNQLFHTAICAATKAGAKAYSTTKDVFNSMQAKQWKPSEGNWTPPKDTFTPPQSTWTPPKTGWVNKSSEWTPSEDTYVPPESKWTGPNTTEPKPATSNPMIRLIEMGFCNREANHQLLERFHGDLESVIQELLKQTDNDWAESRHGNKQ